MAVMHKFLHDESGATTAKVGLVASTIMLLAYGWFHSGGSLFYNVTGTVTSALTVAIRNVVGGGYYGY